MLDYSSVAAAAVTTPNTTGPAHPSGVLTAEQCNAAWMTPPAAPARPDVAPDNFAQATDIARIDTNVDGTIDRSEFVAACGKDLVRAPARPDH